MAGGPDGAALRHIVLVGLMGAGKTTVGRSLAALLRWPLVDSDAAIEHATGRTGHAIAAADGVGALHDLEAAQLLDALAMPGPDVVAAAASVVDDPACRRALRAPGIAVIRLRARPPTLAARHATGAHRRPMGPDPAAAFRMQANARAARFAAVRPLVTIDVDEATPQAVAEAVLAALRGRGSPDIQAGPPGSSVAPRSSR